MSKICQITGKKAMVGNNVSHSKRRTKRRFNVNLFTKKFYYVEQDCWISLNISAAGLRYINKVGLDAALNSAVAKGYCDWNNIVDINYVCIGKTKNSINKIYDILDEKEFLEDFESGIEPEKIVGKIEFKHVWFAYNDENWILKAPRKS